MKYEKIMSEILKDIEKVMVPTFMVVGYGEAGEQGENYMEYRGIQNGKLDAGQPLTKKALEKFATAILPQVKSAMETLRGAIPERLLYYNPTTSTVIWWRPQQNAPMIIRPEFGRKINKTYDFIVNYPALVFKVKGTEKWNTLSVYALKENKKPTDGTQLYHAPFWNGGDNVCQGSMYKPKHNTSFKDFIEGYEKGYFGSAFTHGALALKTKKSYVTFWKEMHNTKKKFPVELLKKHKKLTL